MGVIPEERAGYRPDIDGLRGIAVLAVVAYHAVPAALPGGFAGVDVFFVISGYLITRILLGERAAGTYSLAGFYGRRIRRIFPAAGLVLAACLVAGAFLLLPAEFAVLGRHTAAGAAFVANLVLAGDVGYFDTAADTKPLLHLWSLGIEEQFYLLWPLLVAAAWRAGACRPLVFGAGAVVLAAIGIALGAADPDGAFFSPLARAWELAAGAALATARTAVSGPTRPATRGRTAVAFGGLALIVVAFLVPAGAWPFAGASAVPAVAGAVAVIGAGPGTPANRGLLSTPALVAVGLFSYPLYLWHWPLLSFARIVGGEPEPLALAGLLAAAFVLAWLTWRLVERPVRRTSRRREVTAGLVVVLAAIGVAGLAIHRLEGLPGRPAFAHPVIVGDFEIPEARKRTPACTGKYRTGPKDFCMMSTDRAPSVALLGDSHALVLFPFVDGYFARRDRGVVMIGRGGCPPLPGVDRIGRDCPGLTRHAVDAVIADPMLRDVFVMARWTLIERGVSPARADADGVYRLRQMDAPGVTDRQAILATGLDRLFGELRAAGKRVHLVYGLPELDFDPRRCLPERGGHPCSTPRAEVDRWQAGYRPVLEAAAARHGVHSLDLARAFCDRRTCTALDRGRILYRDEHHLSLYGNDYLLDRGVRLD